MKRPAAVSGVTVYFVLVCLCGKNTMVAAAVMLIFTAAFLLFIILYRFLKSHIAVLSVFVVISVSGMFASGVYLFSYQVRYAPALEVAVGDAAELSGVVTDCRGYADGRFSYIVAAETVNGEVVSGNLLLYSPADLYVEPGDRVTGTLPALYGCTEGEYGNYYLSEDIFWRAYSIENIQVQPDARDGFPVRTAQWRLLLKNRMLQALDGDAGGLLCGMVLGDTSALSLRAENSFTRSGINHIFSVSGFHVSAWSMLPYLLLGLLGARKGIRALVSSLFVLLVTAITGFSPSALRAALMLLLVYLGQSIRLQSDMLNGLGFSLLVICAFNPFSGGSLSLLLSVAATVGLVVFAEVIFPPVQSCFDRKIKSNLLCAALTAVCSSVLMSVTVSALMTPLLTLYFGSVSLMAPLANLILVPLTEIAMMFGGIAALCNFRFFLLMAGEICRWVLWGTDRLASFSLSALQTELSDLLPALMAVGLAIGILLLCKREKWAPLACVLSFSLVFSGCGLARQIPQTVRASYTLSVDDGLALLVQYRGKTLLLSNKEADWGLETLLTEQGVYNLDVLFYTDEAVCDSFEENFAPQTTISYGNASYTTDSLTIESLTGGIGWRITERGSSLVLLFEQTQPETLPEGTYLILPQLSDPAPDLSVYEWVWIGGDGADGENWQYLGSETEIELFGGMAIWQWAAS